MKLKRVKNMMKMSFLIYFIKKNNQQKILKTKMIMLIDYLEYKKNLQNIIMNYQMMKKIKKLML